MKREEKNILSRQRSLEAALREFSEKSYDTASMNTICTENNISKGIIYHYFKDKDELYLLCAGECFDKLTACLEGLKAAVADNPEQMTITFQTIGSSRTGLFLSLIRQGVFYVPFILILPRILGVTGICLSQPAADILTVAVCIFLIRPMKEIASKNMAR